MHGHVFFEQVRKWRHTCFIRKPSNDKEFFSWAKLVVSQAPSPESNPNYAVIPYLSLPRWGLAQPYHRKLIGQ